jgi:hypothetical protein
VRSPANERSPAARPILPQEETMFDSLEWRRDTYARRPFAKEPTAALPGTPEKIAVLVLRAASFEQLFHPRDVRDWSQSPELGGDETNG